MNCWSTNSVRNDATGIDAMSDEPASDVFADLYELTMLREADAFEAFAQVYPRTVLLVDTYDTLEGVRTAIALAKKIGPDCRLTGVRLDSGDLDALSRATRSMLDEAGLGELKIVASGGLTEYSIDRLLRAGAPIDMFGVGADMSVSADAPSLDIAYKLTEYAGVGRMKLSTHKSTMPGRKQVWRDMRDGVAVGDVISRADEMHSGAPLLEHVMHGGKRIAQRDRDLSRLRMRAAELMKQMPAELRELARPEQPYPVVVSRRLQADTADLRARLSTQRG
jgi:nicotinate phosphoribosyltransferase